MKTTLHREGDIVCITKRLHGHQFDIGSLVQIEIVGHGNYIGTQVGKAGGRNWAFEDDECSHDTVSNKSAKLLLSKFY